MGGFDHVLDVVAQFCSVRFFLDSAFYADAYGTLLYG